MGSLITNVILVLVSVGLTFYISIKVKFATDEKTAITCFKNFIIKLILIGLYLVIIYNLIEQFISPEPLTRKSLFIILLNSFALFYAFMNYYFKKIIYLIQKTNEIIEAFIKKSK